MITNLKQYIYYKEISEKLKDGLHTGQLVVDSDPSRFKLLRCGRKWRKTSYMINRLMRSALKTGLVCPYVAPNKTQAKNIAWRDHVTRELRRLKELGIPYKTNEVELTVSFENGGMLQLLGVENKEALRGISNWGDFGGDELDDWSEDIWPLIIRPNLMTNKAPALLAGTPKGMKYIYRLEHDDDNKIFKCFHYSSYDNPALDRQELEEMVNEYKGYGDDYFQQEIMAEYRKPVGLVYKDWPLENFKEVNYDVNLPLHITMDFGVNDPTSVIWIQPNGSEYRVIDYYEASDANIEHFVSVIQSKPYRSAELFTGDPAGKARTITTGTSAIEILAGKGIHVRTKDGVKIPDQIRVTHGLIKSLFVSNKLTRFRDCLLNYRYPEIKDTARNQDNELPIHDEFSHAMRALEYYAVNVKDVRQEEIILPEYKPSFGRTGY